MVCTCSGPISITYGRQKAAWHATRGSWVHSRDRSHVISRGCPLSEAHPAEAPHHRRTIWPRGSGGRGQSSTTGKRVPCTITLSPSPSRAPAPPQHKHMGGQARGPLLTIQADEHRRGAADLDPLEDRLLIGARPPRGHRLADALGEVVREPVEAPLLLLEAALLHRQEVVCRYAEHPGPQRALAPKRREMREHLDQDLLRCILGVLSVTPPPPRP